MFLKGTGEGFWFESGNLFHLNINVVLSIAGREETGQIGNSLFEAAKFC